MRRFLWLPKKIWIPILLVILASGWFFYPRNQQPTPQFATVQKQDLKAVVSSSGLLAGKDNVTLHFKSGGKLAYLNIQDGDTVDKNQLLAGLDSRDLSIAIQQAQNTLREKEAALDKTYDDIHLFQYGMGGFSNISSSNETQTQRSTRTGAEVAKDNAVDNLKLAQKALSDSVITSPIAGTVSQVTLIPGQNVTASDTIAQIIDWSQVYFDTDIDEADITKIQLGQSSEVTLNAYPDKTLKGVVTKILPQTKTTSSGATVVTIKIKLDNPDIEPIVNLNGQASIITKQVANVLTLPQEAVTDGNEIVIQTKDGYQTKKVSTGLRSDTDVEITEGLSEGEQVLTNPQPFLNQQRGQNPLNRLFGSFRPRRG